MWRCALLALAVSCEQQATTDMPPSAPADELPTAGRAVLRAVTRYSTQPVLPRVGDGEFLAPPDDKEVLWITDGRLPIDLRIESGLSLLRAACGVMGRYASRDGAAAREGRARGDEIYRWADGCARVASQVLSLGSLEAQPARTATDRERRRRFNGRRDAVQGAFRGSLGVLVATRRSVAPERRQLVAAWSALAPRLSALSSTVECGELHRTTGAAARDEPDEEVRRNLDALRAAFERCTGPDRTAR